MPVTITTPFNLGNGGRFVFASPLKPFVFNDEAQELRFTVELRTPVPAGDALIVSVDMVIRNGLSTVLSRQAAPAAGLPIGDVRRYFIVGTRTTPTGYTAAKTAERAAADAPGTRRTAMEAHLLAAGHIVGGVGTDSLAYA